MSLSENISHVLKDVYQNSHLQRLDSSVRIPPIPVTEFFKQDIFFVIVRFVLKKGHLLLLITSVVKEKDFYKPINFDQCHGKRKRNGMSEYNWGYWLILLGKCFPLNLMLALMKFSTVSYSLYQRTCMINCEAELVAWVDGPKSGQVQFVQRVGTRKHRNTRKVSPSKIRHST